MYSLIFHLCLLIPTISFFNNHRSFRKTMSLKMENPKYAKEYFHFFRKYKSPILQQGDKPDYLEFASYNKESYKRFEKNYEKIQEINHYLSSQNDSLELDINQYADIIDFEGNFTYDLMVNPIKPEPPSPISYFKILQTPIPYLEGLVPQERGFHWNNSGVLSNVKNQGSCGSCWAFSSTSALETFMRLRNYSVERLSEQELVDCSLHNYGCNGGLMHLAYDYVIENNGLYHNNDYLYMGVDQNCTKLNVSKAHGSQLKQYLRTIPRSILDLKVSVQKNPVAIALDADNLFFRFYRSGVIDVPRNLSKELNHAVLLVGYDYDDKGMYWIIQNSWGEQWGDNGYCKIRARPDEGTLMCQMYGVYPSE